MRAKFERFKALVISRNDSVFKMIADILPMDRFEPAILVKTAGEARRRFVGEHFDIVIINTPLEDDFGIEFALDISERQSVGVLLLVKSDIYEQVSYRVWNYGIAVLSKPNSKQSVYSSILMICAMQSKVRRLEEKTLDLKGRMEEIRLVNDAKWILVEHLKMSEPEAHHYIEKQAMDRCVRKKMIAENILRTYR